MPATGRATWTDISHDAAETIQTQMGEAQAKLDNIEVLYSSIQSLINRTEDVDEKNIEIINNGCLLP